MKGRILFVAETQSVEICGKMWRGLGARVRGLGFILQTCIVSSNVPFLEQLTDVLPLKGILLSDNLEK